MNLESTASQSEKMDTSGSAGGNDLTSPSSSSSNITSVFVGDVISRLYPNVNHQETPLPRTWSTQHKWQTLALTNGNLRVTYKGQGKTHKDAASVRTDFPIPAPCGIYYYEVKIVSKGRDGYMGIGLSRGDVQLNRLPGWDKNSYGYHGDDGHSFCSSGTGQNYGPTFTTGDIIGCCLNLIDNTCFYTKNGYNLGIAFRDMPVRIDKKTTIRVFFFMICVVLLMFDKRATCIRQSACRHRSSAWRPTLANIASSSTYTTT